MGVPAAGQFCGVPPGPEQGVLRFVQAVEQMVSESLK